MAHYIIARGGIASPGGLLNAIVFGAGREGRDKAVALFTDRNRAEEVLPTVGQQKSDQVVELKPGELGRWLYESIRSGIQFLAINPQPRELRQGQPQPAVDLASSLEFVAQKLADWLQDGIIEIEESGRSELLYYCEGCSRIRVEAGETAPGCCSQRMVVLTPKDRGEK